MPGSSASHHRPATPPSRRSRLPETPDATVTRGSSARGGGWVVGQFALMAAAVAGGFVGGWPENLEDTFDVIGAVLVLAGAALATWAARALGSSLTCYPRPRERGSLVETGPYRFSRHPIYSGGIYFF